MSNSITVNGVLFIIYLVIAAIVFYVLGGPMDTLFDSLTNNAVVSQQETMIPVYKTAVRIAFALGVATPIIWFLIKIFSREPTIYQYRRY